MINGDLILRKKYEDFDEDSRTPNGLDLRLGKVYELSEECSNYGLYENYKDLPKHNELDTESVNIIFDGIDSDVEGWYLQPNRPYIMEVDRQIKISDDSAQLYRARSTLLRCGVALYTATGDSSYNGHLSFLCINHSSRPFFMEKGVRFAQLIDFEVKDNSLKYDGDYQEKKE